MNPLTPIPKQQWPAWKDALLLANEFRDGAYGISDGGWWAGRPEVKKILIISRLRARYLKHGSIYREAK